MELPLLTSVFLLWSSFAVATERPIIGIVTEEVKPGSYPGYSSFIAASYVKAVEQSGARVVPIFINRTKEYYRELLVAINGVLFPGGKVYFTNMGGYADAGRIILNYTKEVNSAGDHFPVLGVCLGYELLFYLEIESYDVLSYCNASNVALPLKFKKDFRHSRLFHQVPDFLIEILHSLPMTYNHHKRCVTEELLEKYKLNKKWHVLSTSIYNNSEFISSVESHQYPIAGIQFHPEKNSFEWNPSENAPHSHKAIISARLFYDWLVGEARRNNHTFNNSDIESAALIYNYNALYTGQSENNNYYEQIYLFP